MTPERWQQIDKLYKSVVELEPSEQAAFLKEACGGDAELRREVESLLAHHEEAANFLDKPVLGEVAQVLAKGQAQALVGQQIGSYKVLSLLGAGGMGEVYLAQDSRLGRKIAFKLLPPQFSQDEERVRRLEREARTASALNHPNIVTIYEMGQANSVVYIAMEFVEGKTLREVLGQGALPTKQMLQIAVQAADGLAKAHAVGITHRDLKPENLMITKDGLVKILDFGLAKQGPQLVGSGEVAPTLSAAGTEPGVILGTVGYMSPEQASGVAVDFRSDQFSLGAILYEMVTGKRAFQRGTAAETLSAVIREEPEAIAAVNSKVPVPFRWAVERCLAKNREERYASTRDLARELQSVREHLSELGVAEPVIPLAVSPPAGAKRLRILAAIGLAVGVLAVLTAAFFLSRSVDRPPPTFHQLTFRHGHIPEARFAPDGQSVIYAAAWGGNPVEIYTNRPESRESGLLGLHNAGIFSISSTGEMAISLGCGLNWGECVGTLARVPLTGGVPREMKENVFFADWSPDGQSLAVAYLKATQFRLEYPIGKLLYETSGWIANPRISPKGDLIAFLDHPILNDTGGSVCVVDLSGKKRTLSTGLKNIQGLAWSAAGDEIWFSDFNVSLGVAGLYAVKLSGQQRVVLLSPGYQKIFDISRDGRRLLLLRGTPRAKVIGFTPGSPKERDLSWFGDSTAADLSADGKTLLFYEFAGYLVYLRKTDGSDAVRLGDGKPLALSPDGKWALVVQQQTLPPQLVLLPTGPGEQKLLPRGPIHEYSYWAAWSPDGSRIFFAAAEEGHRSRTYVQDIGGGEPSPVTEEGLIGALLSPDGKRIAALGRYNEHYLCPVEGGEPRPIEGLEDGDALLQWSGDGRSLYVRAAGDLVVKIYKLDLASGRRELWKELTPPDPAALVGIHFNPGEVRLTPDAKSYVYTCWTIPGELYMAEGLK